MSAPLDDTYGAAFIGMVVAAVLYGVTCVQALYYFTHQNDGWYFKLSITAIVIFDTVHQALITHTIYMYTVTDWGNTNQLQLIVWSLLVEVIFTGLTAVIVQGFLTFRIWRLSNRNIYITGTSAILVVGGFVSVIVYVARSLKLETLSSLEWIKAESISVNVLGAAADIFISGTLCSLLNVSRTGYRSDAIINRLIIFTVNTGLLTSFCALASLISILAAPNTFIYITFFFCLGRLYTNSLLASLNARSTLAKLVDESSPGTTSVIRHVSKNSQRRGAISVKIDTIKQEFHPGYNQELQDASSEPEKNATVNNTQALPYDEESIRKVSL